MRTKKDRTQEAEANYFACCLLMPVDMFIEEYIKIKHLPEEERVKELARVFEVPEHAVIHRMRQLKEKIYP